MSERNQELPESQQHKTPTPLAEYMRSVGAEVGREYKTHGEIWDADPQLMQIGLLHLILDELEDMQKTEDPMEGHAYWLNHIRDNVEKLNREHATQLLRLLLMFGADAKLGSDMENGFDIHKSSQVFRRNRWRHSVEMTDLEKKVKRLKSVCNPEDVVNLHGIGKKTALKLLQNRNTQGGQHGTRSRS